MLDGIRGLAILMIVLFHAGHFGNFHPVTRFGQYANMWISSGWIGVDLFFALSGFLITGILLRSRHMPGYFRNFYARRAIRIFPLYYSAILVFIMVMPWIHGAGAIPAKVIWITTTYTVNLAIASRGWAAIPAQMQHFWTLAIEEQFYMVWPLLIYLLSRRRMTVLCGAIIVLAPILRGYWQSQHDVIAAFTFTFCRIDTLALGGLGACLVHSDVPKATSKKILWGCGALALAGLIAEFLHGQGFHFENFVMSTIGYSLVAWLSVALIAGASLFPHGRFSRWCSTAPLRFLGKYSYGLYVCHQPVMLGLRFLHMDINALRRWLPQEVLAYLAFAALAMSCSVLVALCTWRLIESPCMRLKRHFQYSA